MRIKTAPIPTNTNVLVLGSVAGVEGAGVVGGVVGGVGGVVGGVGGVGVGVEGGVVVHDLEK